MTSEGPQEPSKVQVQLFGPIGVNVGSRRLGPRDLGGIKPKQIFEILLLGRGELVPKDRIADVLWGEHLPDNVSATIETYVSLLRRSLDPDGDLGKRVIATEREAYRVELDLVDLDLDRFSQWVERARNAGGKARRRYLEAALELARADVLQDEPYADWAARVRDRYTGLITEAAAAAAHLAVNDGDYATAHEHALRVIAADPYSERCYRVAMTSLYAQGRRREAMGLFETCRRTLAEDLETEPQPQTTQLADALRAGTDLAAVLESLPSQPETDLTETDHEPKRHLDVLLVEDNPADMRMISEALKTSTSHIDLEVAADGEEALTMLRGSGLGASSRPDLILLDLNLPKLSGTEVLTALKTDPDLRRIPVVVLTQSGDDHDILLCYDLGANGYVTKPSDPNEFANVVGAIEAFWPSTAVIPPP